MCRVSIKNAFLKNITFFNVYFFYFALKKKIQKNKTKKKTKMSCICGPDCKCGPNCKCPKENAMQKAIREHNNKLNNKPMSDGVCEMNDDTCEQVLQVFKKYDPNAMILPTIGYPSKTGVCTITHAMPGAPNLKINQLESKSPLSNNALFSTECSDGRTINLYEMMLPDMPSSTPGNLSSAEQYAKDLNDSGLNVAGSHWHWWGTTPFVAAVHHQNIGMNPIDFAEKTTTALRNYDNFQG